MPARLVRHYRHRIPDRPRSHGGPPGFDGPTGNTYGSIATVDYLIENISAAAYSRLVSAAVDLLLWCTSEFNYLRLGDGFVRSAASCPRTNPVALEHARAIASKALGEAQAVVTAVHNTPFGDIVDTEDDLQPLVSAVFHDATRATGLVAAALASAELNVGHLEAHAAEGWTTLTELADTLVREHGLPFSKAHAITAKMIAASERTPELSLSAVLAEASAGVIGASLRYTEERLREVLSPRHFVSVRATWGGPAPETVDRAAAVARETLMRDEAWLGDRRNRLAAAAARLSERSGALS